MSRLDAVDTLVFAGGGVRGLAYAGALLELANVVDFWSARRKLRNVYGCSVGALFGAMVAVGATAEEIAASARGQPLRALIDVDVKLLVSRFGMDTGDALLEYVDRLISAKMGQVGITLRGCFERTGVNLEVMATNLNLNRVERLNHETAPDMRVAEAVVTSMSLPPLFCGRTWQAPVGVARDVPAEMCSPPDLEVGRRVRLDERVDIEPIDGAEIATARTGVVERVDRERGTATVRVERACTLIDGGLLQNYPIAGCEVGSTLGFRLCWRNAFSLGSITTYFSRVACVGLTSAERLEFDALPAGLREATVTIDTGAVSTVDVNLSGESIEALIARGRLATLELIQRMEGEGYDDAEVNRSASRPPEEEAASVS